MLNYTTRKRPKARRGDVLYYVVDDASHMKRALRLAARGIGKTSPNPTVGAVLVRSGRVIAEDYHRKAGTPHAEALVLAEAGDKARGATLYVTLEPCCHTSKRTPPCSKAIIAAGVARVVIAMKDPNPKVSGRGIAELEAAGIKTTCCVLEDKARLLNEAYVKHITTGIPFVTLKAGMTLDGKIATPEGQSKWITSEPARKIVHRLRASVDAVITGIGTVAADDPELTARLRGARQPMRVVIDPSLRISDSARVLRTPPDTLIVTKESGGALARGLEARGVRVLGYKGALDLRWLLRELGSMGMTSVLIEAGSTLNGHALMEGIVDRVMIFVAPKIIGGAKSFPVVGGDAFRSLDAALKVGDMKVRRVGPDLLIEGRIGKPR